MGSYKWGYKSLNMGYKLLIYPGTSKVGVQDLGFRDERSGDPARGFGTASEIGEAPTNPKYPLH